MTLTQYAKSFARHCDKLGVPLPTIPMNTANLYRNAGYSPKGAAQIEMEEYIAYKKFLKEQSSELYSAAWCETQGDNH
jgi:hypothetical protein